MNVNYIITSPPSAEPISLTEAKLHLRVTDTTDNNLITSLIQVAREYCEGFQNRTYVATGFGLKLDDWADVIDIPRPPMWGVSSITYIDTGGDSQTLASTVYTFDKVSEPARLYLDYAQNWPTFRGLRNAITINFTAGYAAPFTANLTTNVCTALGRTYADGDIVRLWNYDGALPAGLATATDYYVISASGSTFKLSATSGGLEIDITDAGTGTHFAGLIPEKVKAAMKLLIGHLYEHREAASEVNLAIVPMAIKDLLWQDRLMGF